MKNPFERMSPRTLRIILSVCALFALLVCGENFRRRMITERTSSDECAWRDVPGDTTRIRISDIVKGGVAEKAGIHDGDFLVAINGKRFMNSFAAQTILDAVPEGSYAEYTIERGGSRFTAKIEVKKMFNVQFLAFWLLGFGFLIVGYVVAMTKPLGKIQRMFGWYGICAMLFFGMFNFSLTATTAPVVRWIFLTAFSLGRFFSIPVFMAFFFYFPVRRKFLDNKWIVRSLFLISALFLSTIFFQKQVPQLLLFVTLALGHIFFFVFGLMFFVAGYFRHVEKSRREQLQPILIGVAVDVVILSAALVTNFADPFVFLFYPGAIAPLLLVIVLPVAFGYSIFRYRLMDIDLIIKRSLIYGTITAAIAATYVLIVYGVGEILGAMVGKTSSQALNIFAFVVIAFIFDPVKRRAQAWIDRAFYQERLNYQKALLEFSQELPRQMNLGHILPSILQTISTAMHVEKLAVIVCNSPAGEPDNEDEGLIVESRNISSADTAFAETPGGLLALLRESRKPQSLGLINEEGDSLPIDDDDKRLIISSGIVLSVPMLSENRLIGTINVGPKLSGKVYSQEDIDLLSTVAGQAAIAIENSRLHLSEIEKRRMEEEMSMARRIQQALLPKSNPTMEGLDIAGVSIPALSVGGDYYDFIKLGEKKILVVVADVSGKGMSAALYMSKIQGMIQLAAHMYATPKEMLIEVNRRIYDGIERKSFITMILALFDLEKREVAICRAGHNKALISWGGELQFEEGAGIGVGLEPGKIFEAHLHENRRALEQGQLFVFYSDGLTEAMNERDEEFGEERVLKLVQAQRTASSLRIQQAIVSKADEFRGEAEVHDDITVVVVKAN